MIKLSESKMFRLFFTDLWKECSYFASIRQKTTAWKGQQTWLKLLGKI